MRALLLATAIVAAAPAWAQQAGQQSPASESSVVVAVVTAPDQSASKPDTSIEEDMDAYIEKNKLANANGVARLRWRAASLWWKCRPMIHSG